MLDVAGVVVVVVVGLWAVAVLWLRGETLRGLDQPTGERFAHGDAPGPELQAVLARMSDLSSTLKAVPMRERNAVLRKIMDEMFADRVLDARFVPVDAGGVSAEWVLAPGADPARRLLVAEATQPAGLWIDATAQRLEGGSVDERGPHRNAHAERQEHRVADRLRLAVGDQEGCTAKAHQPTQCDHEGRHAQHRGQRADAIEKHGHRPELGPEASADGERGSK